MRGYAFAEDDGGYVTDGFVLLTKSGTGEWVSLDSDLQIVKQSVVHTSCEHITICITSCARVHHKTTRCAK